MALKRYNVSLDEDLVSRVDEILAAIPPFSRSSLISVLLTSFIGIVESGGGIENCLGSILKGEVPFNLIHKE